jgi:hypothetical protein
MFLNIPKGWSIDRHARSTTLFSTIKDPVWLHLDVQQIEIWRKKWQHYLSHHMTLWWRMIAYTALSTITIVKMWSNGTLISIVANWVTYRKLLCWFKTPECSHVLFGKLSKMWGQQFPYLIHVTLQSQLGQTDNNELYDVGSLFLLYLYRLHRIFFE